MRSSGTVVFYVLLVILLTIASVQYGLGRLPGDIVVDLGELLFLSAVHHRDHRRRAVRRGLLVLPPLSLPAPAP